MNNKKQLEQPNEFKVVKSRRKTVGQPSKLNTMRANMVIKALKAGLTKIQAARACSVNRQTLDNWIERDEAFRLQVEAAREQARQQALEDIKSAGKEEWQAMARWLVLAFPNDYRENRSGVQLNMQNNTILCDEETRLKIQDMRQRLLGRKETRNQGNGQVVEAEVIEAQEENTSE